MNIYSILLSKPHNPHYLNKYMRFIINCQSKNQDSLGYTEQHHICPKAHDMFPEYSSFVEHPWNCAVLTARQHFIAHMLLWKTYNNRSTTLSLYLMKKVKGQNINSKIYEKLKIQRSAYISDYTKGINSNMVNVLDSGKIRKVTSDEFNKGNFKGQHHGTVMVTNGVNSFRVSKDDPRLASGELFGHTRGMTYAIDSNGNRFYVKKDDPRFKTGELKGNNADTITITNGKTNRRINPNNNIPSGWFRGMTKNSPKGSTWINNGKTSKMFKGNQIPEGWTKGRLFKTELKGKVWITNGDQCKMINPHDDIPQGWKRGRSFSN